MKSGTREFMLARLPNGLTRKRQIDGQSKAQLSGVIGQEKMMDERKPFLPRRITGRDVTSQGFSHGNRNQPHGRRCATAGDAAD
jgi:hypothetical protein